jgi:hypothetical protein
MRRNNTVALLIAAMLVVATTALALPRVGTTVPNATAQSLDGKTLDTRALQGKISLIFYEDKDVTQQNKALKDALELQKKKDERKANAEVHAVANVSAWDFWPAKGFVRDAIAEQQKKAGHPIYCDWSGDFGKALGTVKDKSNVILLGPDRKVILAHAGPVSTEMRDRILRETTK